MTANSKLLTNLRIALRMAVIVAVLVGPLAGLAAAQDDGVGNLGGAGFVLYASIMRAR